MGGDFLLEKERFCINSITSYDKRMVKYKVKSIVKDSIGILKLVY